MKNTYFLITIMLLNSCAQDKLLQLPEISHSEISKINDVSAAYLFYDETKTDSVELNRRNLISSTNWLINVDKRLTLNQVIPHIKFLQEKKRNSSHKKENSKNYFTCNNTSKKNLGFIEFTDVNYYFENEYEYFKDIKKPLIFGSLDIISLDEIYISLIEGGHILNEFGTFNISNLNENLKEFITEYELPTFILVNSKLSFQDYIIVKSKLLKLDNKHIKIFEDELIYN